MYGCVVLFVWCSCVVLFGGMLWDFGYIEVWGIDDGWELVAIVVRRLVSYVDNIALFLVVTVFL